MSVLSPVIDHIDGEARRIYLRQGVSDFHPIEDLYHEYRYLRRNDEDLRKWEPLLRAEGNVPKGAGAYTPRYVVLLNGTKIVPYNETLQLNQVGDIITDDPDTDATLYDVSQLTVAKPIFIKPSEAEVIQLNSESIVFSSFLGGVWVDVNSVYSDKGSSAQPNGNRERPVNNIQMAVSIANERGFDKIFILGNITLGAGDNVDGFTIIGQNPVRTFMTVLTEASTVNCEIKEVTLIGVLDGNSTIRDSVIGPLTYVNGSIYHCILTEYGITLGGNAEAVFIDCSSGVPGANTPHIDMNGSGQPLALRGYMGGIRIKNRSGIDGCSIDMNSGHVIIDSTVTNTTEPVIVRGNAKLTNESLPEVVDTTGLTNPVNSAAYVWTSPTRELTVPSGMTPAQEAKLDALPSLADIRSEMIDVHFGKLEILSNQMKVYDKSGSLIVTYDLFDDNGNPTMSQVYRREVV